MFMEIVEQIWAMYTQYNILMRLSSIYISLAIVTA